MTQNQNPESNQNQSHVRVINSILGSAEKKALLWLAARMPAWVMPDTLTAIGLFASVLIFLGYALTINNKAFLWLASFGFILNWFGDSLDGTLARFRKIERPRYGFFVDHIIDTVDEVLIFIGIGISPYVQFELALLALIMYMMLSIFVYLATYVNGVFRISYGGVGPTETRVLAILANTVVFFTGNPSYRLGGYPLTFYDMIAIALILVGLLIFTINSVSLASNLSREDRAARRIKKMQDQAARKQERINRRQERLAARRQSPREPYGRRKTPIDPGKKQEHLGS